MRLTGHRLALALFAGVIVVWLAGMAVLFLRLPTAFLPEEDQGILFSQIQLPAGATQERTLKVVERVPIEAEPGDHNARYLQTKRDKMGHLLDHV